MKRWSIGAALLLFAVPLVYALSALVLGLIPAGRAIQPAAPGGNRIEIHVRTNGLHADLVLPARGPYDWTREFAPLSIVDRTRLPSPAGLDWIAFGWGDRAFYLETPRWRDLKLRTALNALAGRGPAAMHVEYLGRPQDYRTVRVGVDEDGYRRLVAYVRTGFSRDAQGRAIRIDHPGYVATDAFFEGTGHYSPWFTSNEWVRRGLAGAGVRTALWSPFDVALFWHLDER